MLNLEHPQSGHIFAAAKQIDLILDYSKRISSDHGDGRRFMNNVVAPCFAALHWLNTNHFDNDQGIHQRIDELQSALGRLSQMTTQLDSPVDRKLCPACAQHLTKPSQYDPIPYCSDCLDTIIPALVSLQSCDGGFGVEAI